MTLEGWSTNYKDCWRYKIAERKCGQMIEQNEICENGQYCCGDCDLKENCNSCCASLVDGLVPTSYGGL